VSLLSKEWERGVTLHLYEQREKKHESPRTKERRYGNREKFKKKKKSGKKMRKMLTPTLKKKKQKIML